MNRKRKRNAAQELNEAIASGKREGSLQRNNVYSADAVRDWAWRIRSGPSGIKMNEKFMLIAMSTSSNPRGVCELPVRYLADHIGVGIRQAQRIILQLTKYDLVFPIDMEPQGRPVDIVRTFKLNITLDADTWTPTKTEVPLMRHYREQLKIAMAAHVVDGGGINEIEFMLLTSVYLMPLRSKILDFVSPDIEVTRAVLRKKKFIIEMVSAFLKSEVRDLHLIPKKGYRG